MNVSGKRLIVTGGFGALGRTVGTLLATAGARVALLDVAPAPAGIGGETGAMLAQGGADLTDPEAAVTAIAAAAKALGGLDGLVNIAGAFRFETLDGGSLATWDLMYRLNLRTAVCASQAALTHLSSGGAIVNIGAGAAVKAGAGMGAYAASKSGVMRLTEALAEEQKGSIRVNAILPSIIDTPANRKDMPDADYSRWVTAAEIAAAIQFLLSDAASGITGALVPLAGRL